jgi:hypothetical protein
MNQPRRARGRLALLAVTTCAMAGGGIAAAGTAVAAGDPLTLDFHLSAHGQWGTTVWGGLDQDLTVPFDGETSLQLGAGFTATAPAGALVDSVQLTCGSEAPRDVSPKAPVQTWSSVPTCTVASPSVTTVTLRATDDHGGTVTESAKFTVVPPPPPVVVPVDRYDGASRYGTGIAVSQAAFPADGSAGAVVLARGDGFADALSGAPLAEAKNAPVLLTDGGPAATVLHDGIEQELLRVLPAGQGRTVYILGGTAAISAAVEAHVSGLGYNVVRLAGATRSGTALAVATDPRGLDNPAHVVVARGDDYADALAAGPFAAGPFQDSHGKPAAVVLTSGTGTGPFLDAATMAYVEDHKKAAEDDGPNELAMLAGANVVAVGDAAVTVVDPLPGRWYKRIAGDDRYATARDVAMVGWEADASSGLPSPYFRSQDFGLATGTGFADALTGGAYMALKGGPLMLTPPDALTSQAQDILTPPGYSAMQVQAVVLFGGPAVLAEGIVSGSADSVAGYVAPNTIAYRDHGSAY